jgi:Cu(I)/Ag(I) efflux system membrane fusion protein
MHPSVTAAQMGPCPICNMDLQPVTRADLEAGRLQLDGQRLQEIGTRSVAATKKSVQPRVEAQGEVAIDETRTSEVTLRADGWIRRLRVEETGEYVKRGQTLFELYSPAIVAASDEYIAARKATGSGAARMQAAARRKLEALGVSKRQIDKLNSREQSPETVSIASPSSGYLMNKRVAEGSRVEAGQVVFELAELDSLWIDAQVYERDWSRVQKGAKARVHVGHDDALSFVGKVDFLHPRVDPETRTVQVRIVPDGDAKGLLAGMYTQVEIDAPAVEGLVIPSEAVIYTGARRLVFVDHGGGSLEPRELSLGAVVGEEVLVTKGLNEGERVVASGNFLIAAESRIRSAQTIWSHEAEEAHGGH